MRLSMLYLPSFTLALVSNPDVISIPNYPPAGSNPSSFHPKRKLKAPKDLMRTIDLRSHEDFEVDNNSELLPEDGSLFSEELREERHTITVNKAGGEQRETLLHLFSFPPRIRKIGVGITKRWKRVTSYNRKEESKEDRFNSVSASGSLHKSCCV